MVFFHVSSIGKIGTARYPERRGGHTWICQGGQRQGGRPAGRGRALAVSGRELLTASRSSVVRDFRIDFHLFGCKIRTFALRELARKRRRDHTLPANAMGHFSQIAVSYYATKCLLK